MPASEEYWEGTEITFNVGMFRRLKALESAASAFYEVTERIGGLENKCDDLERQIVLLSALAFSSDKEFVRYVKGELRKYYHGRHHSAKLHKEVTE